MFAMNIVEQNKEKINGILETFDRMIINGYSLNLCNYRHFLYYLIQNDVKLVDFDRFAQKETETYAIILIIILKRIMLVQFILILVKLIKTKLS